MPIKHDDAGKRWIELELLVPGTPEQVWDAMATGPGNTSWFARTEIDERVGGVLRFDFGPHGTSVGEVMTWQPPHTFGYVERDWSPGAPPIATEITITARSGGRCVMRMVHSLYSSSDAWDDQIEGFEGGWPGFFDVLRVYLAHFAGRHAVQSWAMVGVEGAQPAVWKTLTEALGLAGANVGERWTAPAGSPGLGGVVEAIRQDAKTRYAVMRVDTPSPGIALAGTHDTGKHVNASLCIYSYGDSHDAAQWEAWLREAVAPVAGGPDERATFDLSVAGH